MKKILYWALLCSVLIPPAFTADNFTFLPVSSTAIAGQYFVVEIQARNAGTLDPTYNRTANLSSALGPISPTTITFSAGRSMNVGITLTAAAAAYTAITATDSVINTLNSVAGFAQIGPSTANKLLITAGDQVFDPLAAPQVQPITPTVIEFAYCPVTVYAVDAYSNVVPSFTSSVSLSHSYGTVTPPNFVANNGKAYFTANFDTSGASQAVLLTASGGSLTGTRSVNVSAISVAYLWLDIPTWAFAGEYFPLTATASYSQTAETPVATIVNGHSFGLYPYLFPGSTPATGTFTGPTSFQLGSGANPQCKFSGWFSYDLAQSLYLNSLHLTPGYSVIGLSSGVIQIYPNLPSHMVVTLSSSQLQSKTATQVRVQVYDQYLNATYSSLSSLDPQHGFYVQFDQIVGSGSFSPYGAVSTASTLTDGTGVGSAYYFAGPANETATVRITVRRSSDNHIWVQQDVQVRVSIVAPVPGSITNYPNPFNPSKGQKTAINYFLEKDSDIELTIYDAFSRLVLNKKIPRGGLDSETLAATAAGGASWPWDGRNQEGRLVANGIYLVKVVARSDKVQEFKRRVGVLK